MFLCFLPSLEVSWFFSWLYLSALGGSGGWVSLSSRLSRLLLDCREESRVSEASKTGGGTADEKEKSTCTLCWGCTNIALTDGLRVAKLHQAAALLEFKFILFRG